jgi:hypothetical protein
MNTASKLGSGAIGKSMKPGLGWKWKWQVMGPKRMQTCEKRLIGITARVSCDFLAENSAHMLNLVHGVNAYLFFVFSFPDRLSFGSAGLALLLLG